MILHLLKTDFRRHRGYYLFTALALLLVPAGMDLLAERAVSPIAGKIEFSLVCLTGLAAVAVFLLVRPERWLSDDSFWRTRPVSPRQQFAAKSLFIALFLLFPAALSLAWIMGRTGVGGWLEVLATVFYLIPFAAITFAMAAGTVMASHRERSGAWGYQAAFLLPFLVRIGDRICGKLSGVDPLSSRVWTAGPEPLGFLLGFGIALAGSVTAWFAVSARLRFGSALAALLVSGALWPLVIIYARVGFPHPVPQPVPVERAVVAPQTDFGIPGIGVRVGFVDGQPAAQPDEFLAIERMRVGPMVWPAAGRGFASGWPLDCRQSTVTVGSDAMHDNGPGWDVLRRQLPAHEHWHRDADRPLGEHIQPGPDSRFTMTLGRYRFVSAGVFPGRLFLEGKSGELSGVSGPSWVRGRTEGSRFELLISLTVPGGCLTRRDQYRPSVYGPDPVWAVIHTPRTRSAWGVKSGNMRLITINHRLPALITDTLDCKFHFDFPALESALLGQDAASILAESEVYLFVPELVGEIEASTAP